jgi:flagellar biosynthesis chaperone FliJ
MARTKSTSLIEQQIEKAKISVDKAKDRYDAALEKLERLMAIRESLRKEELVAAITNSGKSYDEILSFLKG